MQEATQLPTTPPLSGPDLVDKINAALQTLGTNFSGADDPVALAWAYATWADTGNMRLKRRNGANTAWVDLGPLLNPVMASYKAVAAGSADARTAALDPAITAYVDQALYLIRIPAANATATPTLDLGGGAKTVVKGNNLALLAGDMVGDCLFQYNAALDKMVLINPADQTDFTIIYPNGGSAGSPANVAINTSYVEANPFPGFRVLCSAEILVGGQWGTTGWYTDAYSRGVSAAQHNDGSITVRGGTNALLEGAGNLSGTSFTSPVLVTTPAPCRVKVWKVKGVI